MLDKFLRTGFVVVGTSLAVKVNEFLLAKYIDTWLALLIAVVSSVVIIQTLEFVSLEFPRKFRVMRILLDPIHTIEGYWYEGVNSSDHPHSYACIEFDSRAERFRYAGRNFTSDMEVNATFTSDTVEVLRDSKQIKFSFHATVERPGRSNVRGYATVTFHSDGKREFTRGEGSFVEDIPSVSPTPDIGMREVSFHLDKIPSAIVRSALGGRNVRANDDLRRLVEAYRDAQSAGRKA